MRAIVILSPFIVFAIYWTWVGMRIKPIYRASIKVIDAISFWATKDIHFGREWKWRYDLLRKLEDHNFWLKVWKSISDEYSRIERQCCSELERN